MTNSHPYMPFPISLCSWEIHYVLINSLHQVNRRISSLLKTPIPTECRISSTIGLHLFHRFFIFAFPHFVTRLFQPCASSYKFSSQLLYLSSFFFLDLPPLTISPFSIIMPYSRSKMTVTISEKAISWNRKIQIISMWKGLAITEKQFWIPHFIA